ncbi:MAG: helix-turn-helix transcriptional regulator [Clostridia bacterium]|nr:helix-turn-helix transcriptional regulator [Clostridia bacterium]
MVDLDYTAIGKRIRQARRDKRYTQEDLCFECEISKAHLSHIECGYTKLSLQVLVNIANILGVSSDYLLGSNIDSSAPILISEIGDAVSDCSSYELSVILEQIQLTKKSLRSMPKANTDD